VDHRERPHPHPNVEYAPVTPIHLGISTCPNDTFTFHAILEQRIDLGGLTFDIELLDVEELNRRLFAGDFDIAKASFHAALLLAGDLGVLPVGSALGFGVGPLLLGSRTPGAPRQGTWGSVRHRVLCPGEHTTATLLYKLFHPEEGTVEQVTFSDIMPALETGAADFGVCIHEGRFTWREHGLTLELTEDVMFKHVDLYVNEWTADLGETGRAALAMLSQHAARLGLVPAGTPPLRVFEWPANHPLSI
jgi:predicted solute-binding protein